MKKTVLKVLALVMTAALAFTIVHFAVLGNNTPVETNFTFAVDGDKAVITGATDALSGAVMLPAEYEGHTVTGIGENAFKDCADVTAFFLPSSVTEIGSYAFEGCTSLAQMILPDGLTTIGEGAFWECAALTSVTVPTSVSSIGSCAFYKCDSLDSLILLGVNTPAKGIFNVALDIGQYLSVVNGAREAIDPVVTTVYCYNGSVAQTDLIRDTFCKDVVMLDDCTTTSYTIRYENEDGEAVYAAETVSLQPVGITVTAVAAEIGDDTLVYPDAAVKSLVLGADNNVITFVYTAVPETTTEEPTTEEPTTEEPTTEEPTTEEPTTEEPTTEEPTTEEPTTEEPTTEEPTTEEPTTEYVPVEPELFAKEGSGAVINKELGYVYGVNVTTSVDDLASKYLKVEGDGYVKTEGQLLSTGLKISLYRNDDTLVETYTLVIFGDVNGDSVVNATDVVAIKSFISGASLAANNRLAYFAADMNGDGIVNATDRTYVSAIINGALQYDQAKHDSY